MSMCSSPQMMEVTPAGWQSLAPDGRRGRKWGESLHWSSLRKPRRGRRSNTRYHVHILLLYTYTLGVFVFNETQQVAAQSVTNMMVTKILCDALLNNVIHKSSYEHVVF